MNEITARKRFATARVARLASIRPDGSPHLVPITFAVEGNRIFSAVDDKPKRTRHLARLANIAHDQRVSVLADGWAEDWSQLWWVRADGTAQVLDESPGAVALLQERYDQYVDRPPGGPFILIDVTRWTSWTAAPS